jgi:hypothetical protein
MGVTGEQQVFSGQQLQSVPHSSTAYKLIFFFRIKIVKNICSKLKINK